MFASPMFGKQPPSGGGGGGPIDPATLIGAEIKGGTWSFNDSSTLRVNDDGTGGVPALDASGKWVNDRGPNGKHLRNASGGNFLRRAGGVELSGTAYGLYNLGGFAAIYGNWESIAEPFTIIAAFRILSHSADAARILFGGSPIGLILGDDPGEIQFYSSTLGTIYTVGLNADVIASARMSSAARESGVGASGVLAADTLAAQPLDQIYVGSTDAGGTPTPLLLKHLAIIGSALTNAEVTGVAEWMAL